MTYFILFSLFCRGDMQDNKPFVIPEHTEPEFFAVPATTTLESLMPPSSPPPSNAFAKLFGRGARTASFRGAPTPTNGLFGGAHPLESLQLLVPLVPVVASSKNERTNDAFDSSGMPNSISSTMIGASKTSKTSKHG